VTLLPTSVERRFSLRLEVRLGGRGYTMSICSSLDGLSIKGRVSSSAKDQIQYYKKTYNFLKAMKLFPHDYRV
jgi:hypothetical protein